MRTRMRQLRHVARPGRGQDEVEELMSRLRVRPLGHGVWQEPGQKEDEAEQGEGEEDAGQEDAGAERLRSRSRALIFLGPRA